MKVVGFATSTVSAPNRLKAISERGEEASGYHSTIIIIFLLLLQFDLVDVFAASYEGAIGVTLALGSGDGPIQDWLMRKEPEFP